MSRLIDADSLFKTIEQNDYYVMSAENNVDRGMFTIGIEQAIDEQPTVDAVPVVHGHWITEDDGFWCSNCRAYANWLRRDYCPDCGAKMDEVSK